MIRCLFKKLYCNKFHCLIAVYLFLSGWLPLFGQTSIYKPFPTNGGNWVYQYYDDFGSPTSFISQYSLNEDTIIASTSYKKIFSNSIYLGALRESGKIIYLVPDTSTSTEYVLYDFNLDIGDKIIHPYGGAVCSNDTVTIDYVDSVLASDGYHRQLYLSSSTSWIEGIGSTSYLLSPANNLCVSGNDVLQCMINDSNFLYPSTTTSCFLLVQEHIDPLNISVYPNPNNGFFTIRMNSEIKDGAIFVFNAMGQNIYNGIKFSGNELQINLESREKGIYFVRIQNEENNFTSKIIFE